jgi:serine/threonine-protein kinase
MRRQKTRRNLTAIFAALLLTTSCFIAAQRGADPETRFRDAQRKQEAEGDLQAAIAIYREIADSSAASRALKARALLQLATGLETLGQQAEAVYQRILKEFPGEPAASEAKKKLALDAPSTIEIATPFTNDPWSFALSPDGRSLVFVATVDGKTSLWLRRLDSGKQGSIPGTESPRFGSWPHGANPFWSPDGQFIGYFDDLKLKTIPVDGGAARTLVDAPANTGGAWSRTGDIVFGPGILDPLLRIRAEGGAAVPATALAPPVGAHQYPQFLGDGRRFLYIARGSGYPRLAVGSLDGAEARVLAVQVDGVAFALPDYLLFVSGGAVYVQRLNTSTLELTGASVRLVDRVATTAVGYNAFSASAAGAVAYRENLTPRRRLIYFDRAGREAGTLIQSGSFTGVPRFSPDGRAVMLSQSGQALIVDAQDGQARRLDLGDGLSGPLSPIWSSKNTIVFTRMVSNVRNIYERPLTGSALDRKLLLQTPQGRFQQPMDWHGDYLLFGTGVGTTPGGLLVKPLLGGDPIPVAVSAREWGGRFAPNGNWIAYQSDEIGQRYEIFVQPFPGTPAARVRVSINGGSNAQWSRDGRELYFLSPDDFLMVAPVEYLDNGQIQVGRPQRLFANALRAGSTYAPTPDGRFLISAPMEDAPSIFILSNWKSKLPGAAATPSSANTRGR